MIYEHLPLHPENRQPSDLHGTHHPSTTVVPGRPGFRRMDPGSKTIRENSSARKGNHGRSRARYMQGVVCAGRIIPLHRLMHQDLSVHGGRHWDFLGAREGGRCANGG